MAGSAPSDPIDPVEGIGSAPQQGQQDLNAIQQDEAVEANRWRGALENKQAAHIYSCYMLVIQVVNHLSLDKIDSEVITESQMMNVEQQMQSKMVDITNFLSKIQSESTSYSPYTHAGSWSPDAFLGLKEMTDQGGFYSIGEGQSDWGQEKVSPDYQTAMDKFVSAFKTLFYCNMDDNAPTVSSISTVLNPNVFQNGQNFDLTQEWSKLQQVYSKYDRSYSTDMAGNPYATPQTFNVVSTNPNDKASLIQQYMFYKAQLSVDGLSVDKANSANGDITKVIDLSSDDFLQQVMGMITTFNSPISVSRTEALTPWINTQSDNLLDLILQDQRTNYVATNSTLAHGASDPSSSQGQDQRVGLYGAFNYAAFNYFWTKASSSTEEEHISEVPAVPNPSAWVENTTAQGNGGADLLTGASSSVNTVITNVGTVTGTESSKMQELISNEGENVDIGQKSLQSMKTGYDTFSGNQISS